MEQRAVPVEPQPPAPFPHHAMTVLGMHASGSLGAPSPRESPPAGDDTDDGDDSSPPPLLDPPSDQHATSSRAAVLIANLPELFTVAYDSVSLTARHFCGVRDIPPGPHFFWVAHPGGASARNGFWIHCAADHDVRVLLEWDRFHETLSAAAAGDTALAQAAAALRNLAPYDNPAAAAPPVPDRLAAGFNMWRLLTGSISPAVLDRVAGPTQGAAWLVHTGDRVRGAVLGPAETELERRFSSWSSTPAVRELRFAFAQDDRPYAAAAPGPARSLAARDPTGSILCRVQDALDDADLIGELQLAFVTGTHLGNDDCIQQWWHMVLRLFLRAHDLVARRPALAAAFLGTLAAQLLYAHDWLEGGAAALLDGSSSGSSGSSGDSLRLALVVYKRRLEEAAAAAAEGVDPAVQSAFAKVEAAAARLGWDVAGDYVRRGMVMLEDGEEVELEVTDLEAEEERGEWAPEMVDLDEHGRERGLVSWTD